ncbi:prepilin-type N-terminal cleavage/methylation domain-containing protein [Candidatus Roizmanbacteria bacterium]|nr:prepilin-type N-terminal cleavage/methylation domain-containing protein [Candidatus Roizmanbacteria bacterium]
MQQIKPSRGFTLIEILIAMSIIGLLTLMATGSFLSAMKKGRDARRKSELAEIQKALENFYEDYRKYPVYATFPFNTQFCDVYPSNCSSARRIYMQRTPNDPISTYTYVYESDGTYYKLYSCIENDQDVGPGVKTTLDAHNKPVQDSAGYTGTDCHCGACKFGISSPNTTP